MSYGQQQSQDRPGFSSSSNSFESFGQPAQSPQQPQGGYGGGQQQSQGGYQQQQQQPQGGQGGQGGQSGGYQSSGGQSSGGYSGGSGGGNSGGYGGQNRGGQSSGGYGGGQGGGNRGGYGGQGGGGWKSGGGGGFKGGGGFGGKGGFQKPQLTPEQLVAMPLPKTAVIDGNGRAPDQLVPVIREIADILKRHGYVIRTGGMDGVGKMVMDNVPGCELHIPWKNFNEIGDPASYYSGPECEEFSKRYLPGWEELKDSQKGFFKKNPRLVLGKQLKQPCQIAIIWSDDGVEGPANRSQYSQQAGHIAALCHAMNIPVININNPDAVQRLRRFLGEQ